MKFHRIFFVSLFGLLLAGIVPIDARPPKKLLNGTFAEPGELKYQVGLSLNGHVSCGGALISNIHVLTAAHCFVGHVDPPYTKEYVAVTGMMKRSVGGEKHPLKFVSIHPDFVSAASDISHNDIAVVTLATPVKTNELQAPIALPSTDITERVTGLLSGWGYGSTNGEYSETLRKRPVTIITLEECQDSFAVNDTNICGYDGVGTGFCYGDSGGPLVYNNEIVGIVSSGIACGAGFPDFYTRVYAYTNFIEEAMKHT